MTSSRQLPEFIPPMLAKPGDPFDSPEHLFEVKWDGVRALAFVERSGVRLMSRRRRELGPRYPELAALAELAPGTVVDGEIVVLADGRPDFERVLRREQARSARRIEALARELPVTYVVFDLLHEGYASMMERPLQERRSRLATSLEAAAADSIVLSEGVVGTGRRLFEECGRRGLEGVVAKRLQGRYLPGRRSDGWVKIKHRAFLHCLVLGYLPDGEDDGEFKSLLVATDLNGTLTYVGRVASGVSSAVRAELKHRLRERPRAQPLVSCDEPARWVEPGLYCLVSYAEWTRARRLRAPVFHELIVE